MALLRATVSSRIDLGGTSIDQFENVLDRKLVESGLEPQGPKKFWTHSYIGGIKKEWWVFFRAQPGPSSTRLYFNAFPKNFNRLRTVTLGLLLLEFTLALGYAVTKRAEAASNITLFAFFTFVPLFSTLGVSLFLLKRMLRPDPAVPLAIRRARDATFEQLQVSVQIREVKQLGTYLDSLDFIKSHPLMIYVRQGVDRVAFVLSLILPVLAGVYLFVRREGGGFRLLLSVLATPPQLFFLEYQLIIRESLQFAYVNILFVVFVAGALAWVPLYQCGKCRFRYLDHRTVSCPNCKSKL